MGAADFVQEVEQRQCEKHGAYEAKKMFGRWFSCPVCADERKREDEEKQAQADREIAEQRRKSQLKAMGIKPRFEGKTFANFSSVCSKADEVKRAVESYADRIVSDRRNGESLVFVGKPGTGKTHLASALIHYMADHNRSALMLTAMSLIRCIRETWHKDSEDSEAEVIRELASYDLLIIDEIGIQYGSEAEKLLFFEVLNRRYENQKPSVLMSNLKLEDVKAHLGERIFDRMKEDGGKVFVFDWGSYRGRQ